MVNVLVTGGAGFIGSNFVRYALQARDAVDGPRPVTCKPSSGSRFKAGRTTRVSCSAEDTSANAATTSFTVKVTRRR